MEIEKDKYGVEPLSNFDLMRTVARDIKDRVNIVDTTLNIPYNNIEDLFKGRGHFILFLPSNEKNNPVGHWTVCCRQREGNSSRGKCIYFDSYGMPLSHKPIASLLKKHFKRIEINKKQYQQYNTNLCGFWCLLILSLNKIIPNMTLDKIKIFLESKPNNLSYDKFVGLLLDAI